MGYKKPQIVAKSHINFVASTPVHSPGCPNNGVGGCGWVNKPCMVQVMK